MALILSSESYSLCRGKNAWPRRGQSCGNDPSGEASPRSSSSQPIGGVGCSPAGSVSVCLPRAAASRGQTPVCVCPARCASRPGERLASGTGHRSFPSVAAGPSQTLLGTGGGPRDCVLLLFYFLLVTAPSDSRGVVYTAREKKCGQEQVCWHQGEGRARLHFWEVRQLCFTLERLARLLQVRTSLGRFTGPGAKR